jgi:hypothetical protein
MVSNPAGEHGGGRPLRSHCWGWRSDPAVEESGGVTPDWAKEEKIRVGILQMKNHLESIEGGEVEQEAETRPPWPRAALVR